MKNFRVWKQDVRNCSHRQHYLLSPGRSQVCYASSVDKKTSTTKLLELEALGDRKPPPRQLIPQNSYNSPPAYLAVAEIPLKILAFGS